MNLTLQERETIILFNEDEQTARIETFNGRLLRQLRKVSESNGVSCESDEGNYGVYKIPKTMIKIRAPQKSNLTDEQRAILSERAKAWNAQKANLT